MKRFFAMLICSIIILCHFVPIIPSQAAEVVIEQGIDFFYKSWDMIYSLINGGVIQTSPYQGIADQATAVAAYYEDWGENLLKALNYIVPSDDAIINSQSAITFPLKLGMTRQYYNDFINNYLNYAVDDTNGFKAALTGDALAAWNRYNYNWIQKYLNAFNGDIPVATPDTNYSAYLNTINERTHDYNKFWFYDYPNGYHYSTYDVYMTTYPFKNYSWVARSDINNNTFGGTVSPYMFSTDILNININTAQNGNYFYSVSGTGKKDVCNITYSGNQYVNYNNIRLYFDNSSVIDGYGGNAQTGYSFSYSYENADLGLVLNDISKHFKNVNIYVNNVLWSYVGGEEPTFTVPDVITNSDGVILGHDVYFPEQDLYIDLISWRNLLEDKIADGQSINFDDLIEGGVIVDGNDIPITDEDQETLFKKKEISTVIDIGLEDSDTSDLLPDAPTPPDDDPTDWNFPEFPIPDLTGGDDPKSTGLSVLARIVNVTNKSLPPELISMFWGICVTLIILGIIKILHK